MKLYDDDNSDMPACPHADDLNIYIFDNCCASVVDFVGAVWERKSVNISQSVNVEGKIVMSNQTPLTPLYEQRMHYIFRW